MKPKTLKFLLIIFIGLIGLISLTIYLPRLRQKPSPFQEKIKSINKDSISTIEISKGDQTVKLSKENNIWKVNDKKANQSSVNSLLDGLFSQNTELISQTNRRHQDLELTPEKATQVKLDDKLNFLVGKSGVGGIYLRFADNDAVFLAKDLSLSDVSTDTDDWYDKTIVEIDPSKIKKLTFEKPQEKFVLIKNEEGKWKLEDGDKKVNEEKIRSVASSLSFLSAKSLATEEDITNYPNTAQLTLSIDYNGQTETLKFYSGEDDYLLNRASDSENFILSTTSAETFLLSSQDLLEESD